MNAVITKEKLSRPVRPSPRMEVEAAILLLQDKLSAAKLYGNDPTDLLPKIIHACLSGVKNKRVRDALSEFETEIDVLISEEADHD